MIDKLSQHYLNEITERVYNIYKDRLFVKVRDELRERAMEIINTKKINEKTRRFIMAGFLNDEERMEINKEVEYEMNKHLDFEIDRAFKDGRLKKMDKDLFFRKMLNKQKTI